ncbi:MAG: pyruvate kinase, partial [Arenicellales bacterium]
MDNTLTRPSHVRKTKIVATIGPACAAPEMLKSMIEAGMNVARLNLSHVTHDAHKEQITRLRVAASQLGKNIAIMIDTRGIEIRTGLLGSGSLDLVPGASFSLYTENRPGDSSGVSITYQKLFEEVRQGTPILLDDGAIELEVTGTADGVIDCRVIHGGRLGNSKSVNLPETKLALSAVSPENRDDIVKELSFAAENDVDYIAASFIQSADDIHKMREILDERAVHIPIIAKI